MQSFLYSSNYLQHWFSQVDVLRINSFIQLQIRCLFDLNLPQGSGGHVDSILLFMAHTLGRLVTAGINLIGHIQIVQLRCRERVGQGLPVFVGNVVYCS